MDPALARHVALVVNRSKQGLDDLMELLHNHCDDVEIGSFRTGIAMVDQKYQALLSLVFSNHPTLEQDIGDKKKRFGRPL
jgi:glutathionyl-hydroquinone reductase